MADKPSGDNKTHQIVMAVITTIAAPVIVFMITNNLKNSDAGVATNVPPALTATVPAQPAATNTNAQPAETSIPVQPTLPGISNPSGTIPAGIPALVDGLVLLISSEDVTSDGQFISVKIHMKNNSADRRTLVYTPGSVTVQDDAGYRYEPAYGEKKSGCKKTDLDVSRNLTLEPQGEIVLFSVNGANPGDWCAEDSKDLPLFSGPIQPGAKKLLVQVNGIGPFTGFQMEIGL